MTVPGIEVVTLADGAQRPEAIAARLRSFFTAAKSTLDIAIYDLKLGPALAPAVRSALAAASERGVAVRLVYNQAMRAPLKGPPPPNSDPSVVAGLAIAVASVPGEPDLMHHKYVVRDRSDVWTGSTNWTDDSWSREENVIVTVSDPNIAAAYTEDFEQLWHSREVERTGRVRASPVRLGGAEVGAWFAPGRARQLVHRIAGAIGRAQRRVRVASPVITSGPILGTLAEVAEEESVDLGIVVDGTQIHEVLRQWAGRKVWKSGLLERLVHDPRTSAKRSTPWRPDSVHDFMHAKVVVADDVVFMGSYNLSRSGETNAEDVLEIDDAATAEALAAFIDPLRARYPRFV